VKRYLGARIPAADLIGLRYQAGALVFPRALPRELRDDLWNRAFPLLAPDSQIEDTRVRDAALGALRAQGLSLEQLRVPDSPLFFKHEERPLFVRPGKLRVHPPRPDELNRGKRKVNLSFTLPPGAYATLVVRRVLWFATESARPVLRPPAPGAVPSRSGRRPESERPATRRETARAARREAARNPRTRR
jgi:tRNA pseudouridine13 synthase